MSLAGMQAQQWSHACTRVHLVDATVNEIVQELKGRAGKLMEEIDRHDQRKAELQRIIAALAKLEPAQ